MLQSSSIVKYLFTAIAGICLSINILAQNGVAMASRDYLLRLKAATSDTSRINILQELASFYLKKFKDHDRKSRAYTDSAIWACKKGLQLSDSSNNGRDVFRLKLILGLSFLYQGDTLGFRKTILEAIDVCRKNGDKENEANTWYLLGGIYPRNKDHFTYISNCFINAMHLYGSAGKYKDAATVHLNLADVYLVARRFLEAEQEALQCVRVYKELNYLGIYDAYFLLSAINRYKGDLDRALYFSLQCVQFVDSAAFPTLNRSLFYGELALVYDGLERPEESVKWYKLTIKERREHKEMPIVIIRTAGLLVHQLVKSNRKQEALRLMIDLKKEFYTTGRQEKAAIDQNQGFCYRALGNYSSAEDRYVDMLKNITAAPETDEFTSIAYQDIGDFYLAIKKYEKARYFLAKALHATEILLVSRQRDIYLSLYSCDSAQGNYLGAINNFRTYKMFTDSLFNEKKSRQIEELQIKYDTEKKEKDIILLNVENKAQEDQLHKSKLIRNVIIAGILLMAGFLYYRYRLKSISNRKMEAQQRLINQKNKILTQLLTEKEWLVKEIHHRVKNNFHTVMGLLATQSEFLKNPEAIDAMRESRNRISAMALIHQKLYQSDNLSSIAMPGYIHELVSSLRESFDIPLNIQFKLDIDPVELDLSHAMPLGLILNEAITNAIKYAFPHNERGMIAIDIKQVNSDVIQVNVRDNGIGIPAAHLLPKNSMGMKLMHGLSDDIDAVLEITNDKGTNISIRFSQHSGKNGNA